MYRCPDPNAPILCTLPGGPGQTVMTKVFGRYNPLDIDKRTRSLVRNPNAITGRYNLLYIESPIGNGFSIDSPETKVKNFETLGKNFCEVVKGILGHESSSGEKKYSHLKDNQWFFNGENFCGLQIPTIVYHLGQDPELRLNCKGVILESPIFNQNQYCTFTHQEMALDKHNAWSGCCNELCSNCLFRCGGCLGHCGCLSLSSWRRWLRIPFKLWCVFGCKHSLPNNPQ